MIIDMHYHLGGMAKKLSSIMRKMLAGRMNEENIYIASFKGYT